MARSKVARRKPATPELADHWTQMLEERSVALEAAREEVWVAQTKLREAVLGAFGDGLHIETMSHATNLSPTRLYQIRKGIRT